MSKEIDAMKWVKYLTTVMFAESFSGKSSCFLVYVILSFTRKITISCMYSRINVLSEPLYDAKGKL